MILSIYAYRDKKLGAFETPFVNNLEKDRAAVAVSRALVGLDDVKKIRMKDLDLYYLGSFDDKTGRISAVPGEFICSIDSIIASSEVTVDESIKESA